MSPVVKSSAGAAGAVPVFTVSANQKLTPMMWFTRSRTGHDWHGVGFDNSSGVTWARTDRVLAKARSRLSVLMARDRTRRHGRGHLPTE
jgi:hypothetical protein